MVDDLDSLFFPGADDVFDPVFSSFGNFLDDGIPLASQALAFLIQQRTGYRARGLGNSIEHVANGILGQGSSSSIPLNRPGPVTPYIPSSSVSRSYFAVSRNQMLAQMAAAIARASRRNL